MRFIILRNSQLKCVGFGLQWGVPINVAVKDAKGKLLGLMLNYDRDARGAAANAEVVVERALIPVCEACHKFDAAVWCRAHGLYLCLDCIAKDVKHATCEFISLAAKEAAAHV
jgi:hypothetical protein